MMDMNYFIKDCCNCEHVNVISLDGITIFKMNCKLTGKDITDSNVLCNDFKIDESAKIIRNISDEEVQRIEKEVKK